MKNMSMKEIKRMQRIMKVLALGTVAAFAVGIASAQTGTLQGRQLFLYDNGTGSSLNRIGISTPADASLTANYGITLPATAGTLNQLLVNQGAGVLDWSSTITLSSLTLTNTTNQLVLGTAPNTITLNAPAPAAARVYTMPDAGANASFVMTEGAQTINGAKTFGGTLTLSGLMPGGANLPLQLDGAGNIVASAIDLATADVTGTLPVGNGGTGVTSVASGSIVYGNGTSPLNVLANPVGASVLTHNGTVPSWSSALPSGVTVSFTDVAAGTNLNALVVGNGGSLTTTGTGTITANNLSGVAANGIVARTGANTFAPRTITGSTYINVTNGDGAAGDPTISLTGTIPVGNGGTGATTLTSNGVLFGNGTSAVGATAAGVTGEILVGNTGSAPTWATASTIIAGSAWALGGNTSGITGTNNILGVNYASGLPVRLFVESNEAMRLNTDGTVRVQNLTAASATTFSIVGTASQGTADLFQIRNSAAQSMLNVHQVAGTSRLFVGQTALPGIMALSSGAHWIYSSVESDLAGSRNYTLPTTEADGQYVISNGDGTANQILQSNGNDLRASWTSSPSFTSLTLSGDVTVGGTANLNGPVNLGDGVGDVITLNGTMNFPGGTAGLPLQLDGSGNVVTAAIGLASSDVTGTLPVGNGGTGATTLASNGVLFGNGTGAIGATAEGTTGQILVGTTGSAPSWASASSIVAGTAWALGGNTSGITGANNILGINHASGQPLRLFVEGSELARLSAGGTFRIQNTSGAAGTSLSIVGTATQGIQNYITVVNNATNNILRVDEQPAGQARLQLGDASLNAVFRMFNATPAGVATISVDPTLAANTGYVIPTIEAAGTFTVANGVGTSGQILQSNGTGNRSSWTSSPTLSSLTLTNTTNQLVLGSAPNTTTISSPAPAAPRTYTVPDAGANASFVMTEGAQTINGTKTFGGNVLVNGTATLGDALGDQVTINAGTVSIANVPSTTTTANVLVRNGNNLQVSSASFAVLGAALGANQPVRTNGSGLLVNGAIGLATSDVTGTLPVGNGGTGVTSVAAGSIVYGNGTSPLNVLANPVGASILTHNGTVPSWSTSLPTGVTIAFNDVAAGTNANALSVSGSLAPTGAGTITANQFVSGTSASNLVDLDATSAEVSGVLPIANGGTGASTAGAALTNLGAQASDAGLTSLAGLASTGIVVQSAGDGNTFITRAIAGTSNEITVTNGDGVLGNPVISIPTAVTFTSKTITGGTYAGPSTSGTATIGGTVVNTPAAVPINSTAAGATLGAFTNTFTKVAIVPDLTANSFVNLPTGTDGQVMYLRVACTNAANTFAVTVRNSDGTTATGMAWAAGVNAVYVAHMIYSTDAGRWAILSVVANP